VNKKFLVFQNNSQQNIQFKIEFSVPNLCRMELFGSILSILEFFWNKWNKKWNNGIKNSKK
jgi:hypothetical protein